jgi:pimeloyl-ACP methyl ester carboxylesterase
MTTTTQNAAESKPARTIVLIPGLWMTSLSWERWVERYKSRGYEVIARNWPGMEGRDVEELRRDTASYANVGVGEVVEHYEKIIRELDRPTIIMGHSFGGAVTQILLDHGVGVAGVAIDSAPIKGVYRLPFSSLKSSFPVLKNPTNNHKAVMLSLEEFHWAFANTLTEAQAKAAYERYAIPGPGRPLFQAAFANFNPRAATKVDFHNDDRAPLLLIAGGEDHIAPPSITKANARAQHKSKAITAYKEFPGRSHFILGQEGWEEVADFALSWAANPVAIE